MRHAGVTTTVSEKLTWSKLSIWDGDECEPVLWAGLYFQTPWATHPLRSEISVLATMGGTYTTYRIKGLLSGESHVRAAWVWRPPRPQPRLPARPPTLPPTLPPTPLHAASKGRETRREQQPGQQQQQLAQLAQQAQAQQQREERQRQLVLRCETRATKYVSVELAAGQAGDTVHVRQVLDKLLPGVRAPHAQPAAHAAARGAARGGSAVARLRPRTALAWQGA